MGTGEQLALAIRVVVAAACGSVLGWERWMARKFAGIRTHAVVAVASALACVITELIVPDGSEGPRTLAAVFTGVGFIGAGAIMQTRDQALGITTSATVLLAAIVGATAGLGAPLLAAVVALGSIAMLRLLSWLYLRFPEEDHEPTQENTR